MIKKNYIIFSSLKILFPKNKKSNIFAISEDAFDNKFLFKEKYNKVVISKSRWSNKKILSKDSKYIYNLNKRIIKKLCNNLNRIHKTNYTEKFWFILISPWSLRFIQILFDRWFAIKSTIKKNKNLNCNFLTFNNHDYFIPLSAEEFIVLYRNDYWNQFICQEIANFLKSNIKVKNKLKFIRLEDIHKSVNYPKYKVSIFKTIMKKIFKIFNFKNYKYFIYNTNLGFFNELLLSLKLYQLPIFQNMDLSIDRTIADNNQRSNLLKGFKSTNDFENFLIKITCNHLPFLFLEKFSELEKNMKNKNLPLKPIKIFSSYGLWSDTAMNYYCAQKIENKTKLFYGQHGGTYGIAQTHFQTDYEIDVADKYLNWGWKKKSKKIINFGKIQKIKKLKFRIDDQKNLLFIINKRHKYSTFLNSSLNESIDFLALLKFNSKFLTNLSEKVRDEIIIRPMPGSNFANNYDFFGNLEKNYKTDNESNITKLYKKSKLVVHTLNSTSLIETLSLNLPTIVIFDKIKNPFTKEGKKIFNLLEKNNIFFSDPLKASKFLNKIWDNKVSLWWGQKKTQSAIKKFNSTFSKKRKDMISDLKDILINS